MRVNYTETDASSADNTIDHQKLLDSRRDYDLADSISSK